MLFHEKLDYLLSASGMSNIKLAKKMNVDASLISKWRRGAKIPNKKVYVVQICDVVVPSFRNDYQREDLARVSGIPLQEMDNYPKTKSAVVDWLCENETISYQTTPVSFGRHGEPVYDQFDAAHKKRRDLALQSAAAVTRKPGRIPCLRIYSDEPYNWMRFSAEQLDAIAEAEPGLFSKVERVSLLFSGANKGEKELRCCWDIMEYFTNHCEVSVAMTDERYSSVFQHAIIIVGEASAITSLGLNGGRGVFSFLHSDTSMIRELIDAFDTMLGRSQTVIKEYTNYTAWEEAGNFQGMLGRHNDIYYRSYDIPPILVPQPVIHRVVYRSGGGSVFGKSQDAFLCDIHGFWEHNRLYATFPLLRPNEVEDGAATFPHTAIRNGDASLCEISAADYLEILKYTVKLYERNNSLILKPVAPGEIEHNFLGQEENRYSLSKRKPRIYTYLTTHSVVVASAIRQQERYFSDAPAKPAEREQCLNAMRQTINDFEQYLDN